MFAAEADRRSGRDLERFKDAMSAEPDPESDRAARVAFFQRIGGEVIAS